MKKTLFDGINISRQLIYDIIFMYETRTKSTYFTRPGKISFHLLLLFMLNFVRKSLQLELDGFFNMINTPTITKQAFSEARQKISPEAFIKLADGITSWYYDDDDFKTFKGYRLLAVDGSVLELNNSEVLRQSFGYVENQNIQLARAQASGLLDLENGIIITSKIAPYKASERDLALEHIEKLKQFGIKNDLLLLDRGYPSSKLILYLETNGIKYLMRVPNNFLKPINDAKAKDQVVKIKIDDKTIEVRVLRFFLDSGVEEILITNILEPAFGILDFKELYFKTLGH